MLSYNWYRVSKEKSKRQKCEMWLPKMQFSSVAFYNYYTYCPQNYFFQFSEGRDVCVCVCCVFYLFVFDCCCCCCLGGVFSPFFFSMVLSIFLTGLVFILWFYHDCSSIHVFNSFTSIELQNMPHTKENKRTKSNRMLALPESLPFH